MTHVIKPALTIPKEEKLLFGLSLGYPDEDAPANRAITERADLDQVVRFIG
jgi:nitroreductase